MFYFFNPNTSHRFFSLPVIHRNGVIPALEKKSISTELDTQKAWDTLKKKMQLHWSHRSYRHGSFGALRRYLACSTGQTVSLAQTIEKCHICCNFGHQAPKRTNNKHIKSFTVFLVLCC